MRWTLAKPIALGSLPSASSRSHLQIRKTIRKLDHQMVAEIANGP
jgi:hypothetical protein